MQSRFRPRRLAALLPLALACLAAPAAHAAPTQSANAVPIVALSAPGEDYDDAPSGVRGDLLLASDGNIYFGSYAGGDGAGAIAKLTPEGVLSTVRSLEGDGTEGVTIYGPLMQASDGYLYGTAYFGGNEGGGTLYRLALDGSDFSVVHEFGGGEPNPIFPYTGVTEGPDGLIYGTTFRGGTADAGVVYRVGKDGSDFTVLHHFSADSGENPEGTLLVAPDGMLYGTTMMGGSNNRGTIYRISTSGAHEVVYSFPSLSRFNSQGLATNSTGANPRAGLTLGLDGNFYGTTYQGGPGGHGTVFRLTPAGELSVFHAFMGPSFGGANPLAALKQDAAGNFYGTTQRGGYLHRGAAFRLSPDGSAFTLLHSFSGSPTDGQELWAGLLLAHGAIYAASFSDTLSGAGALVRLDEGSGGVAPVMLSVSASEVTAGSGITFDWSAPAGATCTKIGGTLGWTGDTTVSGSQVLTPQPGTYAYGLSCTDADDGIESTPRTVRLAWAGVLVNAPTLDPVDGGGGAGALSLWWLLAIAALLYTRNTKETRPTCP